MPSIGERNRTPSSVILRRLAQAEHLEAAGVGEDRALPVHEAVQPAVRAHDLVPGRSIRWNVLPSTICAPRPSSSSGVIAFTVP